MTVALPPGLTAVALVLHIGGGTAALAAGTVAAVAAKGGRVHRAAGNLFFGSMAVMALFACYLAVAIPDQLVNIFIASFAFYLVATSWITVRRPEGTIGIAERIAALVAFLLWAPFAILSFQLAAGLPPLFRSAIPFEGPVLFAIYAFTAVLAIAVISDARLLYYGGISGAARITRHLWRMCLGLTLAVGSAFSNGLARLMPGPYHVPLYFHLPKLLPLGLLLFWLIRVRFTDWYARDLVRERV